MSSSSYFITYVITERMIIVYYYQCLSLLATQNRSLTALLTRVTHGETPRWRLQHISIRPGAPGADEGVTHWQGNEGTHTNMHAYSAKGRSKDTAETPPLTKAFRERFLAARGWFRATLVLFYVLVHDSNGSTSIVFAFMNSLCVHTDILSFSSRINSNAFV